MTITSKHIAGLLFTLITFSRATANETIDHPAQQPKVLNNFVTQLITANDLGGEATHSFKSVRSPIGASTIRDVLMRHPVGQRRGNHCWFAGPMHWAAV